MNVAAMTLFAILLPGLATAQSCVTSVKAPEVSIFDGHDTKIGIITAGELINRAIVGANADRTRYQVTTTRGVVYVKARDVETNGASLPPPVAGCSTLATRAPGANLASNGLSGHCGTR